MHFIAYKIYRITPVRKHHAFQVLGAHAVDVRAPIDHALLWSHQRVHQLLTILSPHDAQPQQLFAVALLGQGVLEEQTKGTAESLEVGWDGTCFVAPPLNIVYTR